MIITEQSSFETPREAIGSRRTLREPQGSFLDPMICRAQAGDAEAFERIYRFHARRVYSLCLHLLHDPVEAEDFAQEVFLQLFRKIHTFRGEAAFSSWLYRLSANVVFVSFRKKKLPMQSLEVLDGPDETPEREIGVADRWLSGLFDRINLEAAIAGLLTGYKEMLILHDVEGYEHYEIAKLLGCSVGNSKSQLHKARKRLRKALSLY